MAIRSASSELDVPSLPPSIYLDGCAWGCGFYVGVQRSFERVWGPDFGTRVLMQGDSAGGLLAVCWALGLPSAYTKDVYEGLADGGSLEMMKLRLSDYHDRAIDAILEAVPDAHERLTGRLQLGVTRFPQRHQWIGEWSDAAALRRTLHATMHIPVYCRETSVGRVVDGAISMGSTHLAHGDATLAITAAVWAGLPGERFFDIFTVLPPTQCFLPPDGCGGEKMMALGEEAADEWLRQGAKTGRAKRRSPLFEVGGAVTVAGMWSLRAFEHLALPTRMKRPVKGRFATELPRARL